MSYSSFRHPDQVSYASLVVRHGPDAIPSTATGDADEAPVRYLAAVAELRRTDSGLTLCMGLGAAGLADTLRGVDPSLSSLPRLHNIRRPARPQEVRPGQTFDALVTTLPLAYPNPDGDPIAPEAAANLLRHLGVTNVELHFTPEGENADLMFDPTKLNVTVETEPDTTIHFANVDAGDIAAAGTWAALAAASAARNTPDVIQTGILPDFSGQPATL